MMDLKGADMKRMFKLFVVLTVMAGWPLALSAIHVVRTPGQLPMVGSSLPDWGTVHVFTKESLGFKQTFADTRAWTLEDIANRPQLVSRMIARGMTTEIAPAGSPEDIALALKGEIKPKPAIDPWANPPAPHGVSTPVEVKTGKPIEPAKQPQISPRPSTQPAAKDDSIFGF